jgi:hypothetical protein
LTPKFIFLEKLIRWGRSALNGIAGKDTERLEVSGFRCQVSGKRKIEAEH